jgi:hypothetical protein
MALPSTTDRSSSAYPAAIASRKAGSI